MIRVCAAEVRKLMTRPAVLFGLGLLVVAIVVIEYLLPAVRYSDHAAQELYPDRFTNQLLNVFFIGGILVALLMGTLVVGSEYGWGTLRTVYAMGVGRLQLLVGQLLAAVLVLTAMLVLSAAAAAASSLVIATVDGSSVAWPAAGAVMKAMGAVWLILACYVAGGIALGHLLRSAPLAIGVGLSYVLFFELTFVNYFARFFGAAGGLQKVVPGTSASSLIAWVIVPQPRVAPPLDAGHTIVVLALWTVLGVAVSAALVWRRDVV
jgi:ABC-type transport system involved in multi-copper enzyme maturation permease subunit